MEKEAKSNTKHKLLTIIGVILCLLMILIIIINVSLIVRSFADPDHVPSIGGTTPQIIMTDSMYPEIKGGDLIVCRTEDAENIQVGDIIAFFDPAGNGTTIVTHRVAEINEEDGEIQWITKGDANNAVDAVPVPATKLVGVYKARIPLIGNMVMFLQTNSGLITCVICPIVLLAVWYAIRRRKYEKSHTDALMKELEELRALKEQKFNNN